MLKGLYAERTTEDVFLMATGAEINAITPEQWKVIRATDSMAVNNFFYHPEFVPKWIHVELKKYDGPLALERLSEKWNLGWKNVGYVFPVDRSEYIKGCIPKGARIYNYAFNSRGEHPRLNPKVVVDANFDPNASLYKSYDSSMTTIFQILYLMGYKRIIVMGATMRDSRYFWTGGEAIYGKVHHLFNKSHEHNDPGRAHNASHIKDYVVDFHRRHMAPYGRSILVGHTNTALYPELKLWTI